MRKKQTQTIAELISSYLQAQGFEDKLLEVRIKRSWEEILGKTFSRYTKSIFFRKNILYVSLNSSIVKNELMLIRDELIRKLNEKAGKELIHKIIFR